MKDYLDESSIMYWVLDPATSRPSASCRACDGHQTCGKCGGSGGGPELVHQCSACAGSGACPHCTFPAAMVKP